MSVVDDGRLKGSFKGFHNRDTIFEFQNGKKWRQKEYKYLYHYAYAPEAKVIQEGGRYKIQVDGVNDTVEVEPD